MITLSITASVGVDGKNKSSDVIKVKARMKELGFTWLNDDGQVGPEFIRTIRLFQAIKNGLDVVNNIKNDGRIDLNGDTHKWLQAENAPRWIRMPEGSKAEGFINDEIRDNNDNHDYGTNWLSDTLIKTAADYKNSYLKNNPGAALLTINDTSIPRGGDTPSHGGHETGLVCDLRLPRKDGKAGGTEVTSSTYDRNAMRAMLKSFRKQPLFEKVFLNDTALINEGLCRFLSGHHNHAHFEILPPARIM